MSVRHGHVGLPNARIAEALNCQAGLDRLSRDSFIGTFGSVVCSRENPTTGSVLGVTSLSDFNGERVRQLC